MYLAHRLAFLHVTGGWPPHHIDHRDGDPANNRWTNLRPATNAENMQNRHSVSSNNKSGRLGVSPNGYGWMSQIRLNGKVRHLGTFATVEDAHLAYLKAKSALHPFARTEQI